MTQEIQTKCTKCNSDRIWLEETLGWKCYIDPDTGSLNCKNSTNEISSITCLDCGEVFDYNYDNEINFD